MEPATFRLVASASANCATTCPRVIHSIARKYCKFTVEILKRHLGVS
jgi:hypothetical protein